MGIVVQYIPHLVHYQGHVISDKAFLVGLEAVVDVCWEVLVGQLGTSLGEFVGLPTLKDHT